MKISLNWIQKYLEIDKTPKQLEEALTLIGFEVEHISKLGLAELPLVVVGEVLSSVQHPNAEKLSVCKVQTTIAGAPRQIVCGAKNYKVGDRVPVALPGTVLGADFVIKESKLRGELSQGMMCSARELGLGEDHGGLLILTERPEIGTPINQVFPGGDVIFDIEVTPNRPDCLSHVGIARELAAYFDLDLTYPHVKAADTRPVSEPHAPLLTGVKVETVENCPHYRAYSIRGVKVAPSPAWLQDALKAVGLRPINNIVDVTNFICHELGQPLHAFDAKKLAGNQIIVRQATAGEKFTTLDGKERTLDAKMTVIADADKAIALAGVMGGLYSEVDDSTTDIVLEAAYFNPSTTRYTARRLALSTDASYRYERGIDPQGTEFAAIRAIDLILETAGGQLSAGAQVVGEPPYMRQEIELTPKFVVDTLGFPVEAATIKEILERLELSISESTDNHFQPQWTVTIPSFRVDLDRPVDLVEEFLRIYGTDKIPASNVISTALVAEDDAIPQFLRKASAHLVEQGFNECIHYTMRSAEETAKWYPQVNGPLLALANPLASDQSHLRPSLIPGLLDALRLNQNRRNNPRGLFEHGRVFREVEGKLWELVSVAFVIALEPQEKSWLARDPEDFYSTSRLAQNLLRMAGVEAKALRPEPISTLAAWQDGHSATIGNATTSGYLAEFGLLNLHMTKAWDISGNALAGELCFLPTFLQQPASRSRYTPLSAQPDTTRDLALVVDAATPAETVRVALEKAARHVAGAAFTVEQVSVFDVYQGTGLPEGRKSLALSLRFRAPDRTLTDDEVNKAFVAIQQRVTSNTGYAVRS
ncbi:MAG: phenylalanine--tRNA ligase subunit beta [Verrucomicrobiota bacterium]|nr:phenylalanine--tRNA ligase subunit beta [Verrucomicrobiota bacterium]